MVQRSKRGRQSLVDREASILKVGRRNAFESIERSMLSNRKEKVLLHCYSRSVSAQLNDRVRVMKTHLLSLARSSNNRLFSLVNCSTGRFKPTPSVSSESPSPISFSSSFSACCSLFNSFLSSLTASTAAPTLFGKLATISLLSLVANLHALEFVVNASCSGDFLGL